MEEVPSSRKGTQRNQGLFFCGFAFYVLPLWGLFFVLANGGCGLRFSGLWPLVPPFSLFTIHVDYELGQSAPTPFARFFFPISGCSFRPGVRVKILERSIFLFPFYSILPFFSAIGQEVHFFCLRSFPLDSVFREG